MGKIRSISDLNNYVGNKTYVSFDLFDTLIKRRYLHVNEVHDTVSAFVLAQIGQMHKHSPSHFTALRYNMCTALKGSADGTQEPEIGQIWDRILVPYIQNTNDRINIVQRTVEFENSIELKNLELVYGSRDLLLKLRSENKVLIAISDMYFSFHHMEIILTKLGIFSLFDHVFISCDSGLTKQTGDLFRHVLARIDKRPHELLHVGDNSISDIDMAAKVGISAVHVEQQHFLQIERTAYGKRKRVEEDIADVVKCHLFSVLLDACNNKSGQIYFMARDALAISSFFERWKSDFRDTFLPSPGHVELYLNRALTIWANVDFSIDWLPHAIGIAFWLKEGTATAAELSDLFGIAEVPANLGDERLTSLHDTFRAAHAYREAGLQESIKNSILQKRLNVERYLHGIGFFDHKSVIVSDVGYSGTVARALNTLLVQRCAEGSPHLPPAMALHLIITHHNYEVNRPFALPFCDFTDRIPFPVSALPESLSGSYAWLEYFFKHPTMLPIVDFVERDGKLEPELRARPEPGLPFPSQRLLDFAEDRDEDIVLLWMAATNKFGLLTDALIDRFSNPDPDTIQQMREPIYELDPIAGTMRTLILEVPNGPADAVAEAARKGDYWIPGSLVVSNAVTDSKDSVLKQPRKRRWHRDLLRWFRSWRWALSTVDMRRGFEPDFYGSFYPDLRAFSSHDELWHHYVNHGRRERRSSSRRALRTQLFAEFGPVPDDFDWGIYVHLNPDLETIADTPERALDHYMRSGRHEGRSYRLPLEDVRREFELLRHSGTLNLTNQELKRVDNGESTMLVYLHRHLIVAGPWLLDLDLADFTAMHRRWAGDIKSRADAIVAICEKGLDRMPSLSLRAPFDPAYYRSQAPELAELDNVQLYRHYLNHGYRVGFEPSEQASLRRIWGREDYPRSFDWKAWQNKVGKGTASRCNALKDFIDAPGTDKLSFVTGGDAAQFLEFLGTRAWWRQGRVDEARSLFKAAIATGGNAGWLEHLLGDLEAAAGNVDQAIWHYRRGQAHKTPNRWSYVNAAELLLRNGDFGTALESLEAGRGAWQEMAPWRRLYDQAMHLRSNSCVKLVVARPGGAEELKEVDQLAADIASRIPAATSFDGSAEGVIVFTGRPLATGRDIAKARNVTLRHLRDVDNFDYLGALLQHGEAVFHEVPFTYEVLRAILTARALGKRTTLWLGDLRRWRDLDLDQTVWGDAAEETSWLRRSAVWEMALVARYCDHAVTTVAGCSRAIALLAPHTPCEEHVRRYNNVRGDRSDIRAVLVMAPDEASDEDLMHLAEAIDKAAGLDSRLRFLVDHRLAERRELRDWSNRLVNLDSNQSLPLLAATIATVDLVVQSVRHDLVEPYDAWKEAETAGVPAIVIRQAAPKGRAERRTAVPLPAEADLVLFDGDLASAMVDGLSRETIDQPPPTLSVAPFNGNEPARLPHRRKRILFVNIWFAPQAIGGATRVLTDNVDYIIDHHADDFELAAFASDEFNDRCGEFTLDMYRGQPVFRIATPQEANIYWRPNSAMAGARFAAVLDSFKPDLVHIHCLQRLGGTIAEVCHDRGVPYIVTLHDAWWLSDFPFLSDTRGMPTEARHDYYDQPRLESLDPMLSATRAQRLRHALLGAQHRLAVSKSFRRLYESCGIPCEVIENGASRIARHERTINDRVRLCHVGGLERHKGAYLIEAALKQHNFANLELTLIDLARTGGQDTRILWGTTPVSITGRMTSNELAAFYARSNVLLAPSTCEESFGLASREALAHGLWVVAGDRGAMAEPIMEGKNGYIVSVDDASDLARVLQEIDQNPSRYTASPEQFGTSRTADDQSRDLVRLYQAILDRTECGHQVHSEDWSSAFSEGTLKHPANSESAI